MCMHRQQVSNMLPDTRDFGAIWIIYLFTYLLMFYVSLTCQMTTLRWQLVTVSVGWTRTTTRGSVLTTAQLIHASVQHYTTSQQRTTGLSLTRRRRLSVRRTTFQWQWRFSRVRNSHSQLFVNWPLAIECKLMPATRWPSICFCTLWHCDLDLWPFDLILSG